MENINEHDMTKHMLDRLRGGNVSPNPLNEQVEEQRKVQESQQTLDEHDMTKRMLGTIRETNITESQRRLGNLLTEGDDDVKPVDEPYPSDHAQQLMDAVSPVGVDLKQYDAYPKERNVIMVGTLDNGIEFKFSKNEDSPYINATNLRLDRETTEVIKKLHAYYINWKAEWATNIKDIAGHI